MKYDERACKFNMDTGCVELILRDGRKISIDVCLVVIIEEESGIMEMLQTAVDGPFEGRMAYADR